MSDEAANADEADGVETPRRRRPNWARFRLSTLMFVTLLVCLWLATRAWQHRHDAETVDVLRGRVAGLSVTWRGPWWLPDSLGQGTIFTRVDALRLADPQLDDDIFLALPLERLPTLRRIEVDCVQLTSEVVWRKLGALRGVDLEVTVYPPPAISPDVF